MGEMRQKFVLRVKEKEAELKEAEKELHAKFDKMKQTVADEKRVVDEQRRALDEEIADFQRRKVQYETDKMNSGHHTLGWGKRNNLSQQEFLVMFKKASRGENSSILSFVKIKTNLVMPAFLPCLVFSNNPFLNDIHTYCPVPRSKNRKTPPQKKKKKKKKKK